MNFHIAANINATKDMISLTSLKESLHAFRYQYANLKPRYIDVFTNVLNADEIRGILATIQFRIFVIPSL